MCVEQYKERGSRRRINKGEEASDTVEVGGVHNFWIHIYIYTSTDYVHTPSASFNSLINHQSSDPLPTLSFLSFFCLSSSLSSTFFPTSFPDLFFCCLPFDYGTAPPDQSDVGSHDLEQGPNTSGLPSSTYFYFPLLCFMFPSSITSSLHFSFSVFQHSLLDLFLNCFFFIIYCHRYLEHNSSFPDDLF